MKPGISTTLPGSVLVVTATWTIVFGVLSDVSLLKLPVFWGYGVLTAIGGILLGITAYILYTRFIEQDRSSLPADGNTAVKVLLYTSADPTKGGIRRIDAPFALKTPPRAPMTRQLLAKLRTWPGYDAYVSRYPEYAAVFNAIAAILAARQDVAASHVPGGHAGLNLFDHSLNVVRAASRMAGRYRYYGLYRNGKLMRPVADPKGYYAFKDDDPIIPIAALAHDLGKLISYEVIEGKTTKKMEAHDIPGRRLLSLVPELYALPTEDKHAICMAVGLYHHIHGGVADGLYRDGVFYSDWISDRIYAMIHFLEYVDIQTGRIESGQKPLPFFEPQSIGSEDPEAAQEAPKADPTAQADTPATPSAPEETASGEGTSEDGLYFQWFVELIRQNARKKTGAIAHRYNGWVFVDDTQWRKWLRITGKPVANPESLLRQPSPGVIHPITLELLRELADKNLLLLTAGDKHYTYKSALYHVSMEKQDGTTGIRQFVIVVSENICPEARRLPESKFPLTPQRSSFGEQRALRTKPDTGPTENPPQEALPQETLSQDDATLEPAIEDTTATIDDFLYWLAEVQDYRSKECPAFPEKPYNGETFAILDITELPDRFSHLDLTTIPGSIRSTQTPNTIAIPKSAFSGILSPTP